MYAYNMAPNIYIYIIFLSGADTSEVEEFEALLLSSVGEHIPQDISTQFVEFYKSTASQWNDIHPTILNRVLSKHILIKGFTCGGKTFINLVR